MLFQQSKKDLKEFQVFLSWQYGYVLWIILLFVKAGRVDDDEVGFLLGIENPGSLLIFVEVAFYIPTVWLYLWSGIGPIYHIQGPASAVECQADIRCNTAAAHGIKDQIVLP